MRTIHKRHQTMEDLLPARLAGHLLCRATDPKGLPKMIDQATNRDLHNGLKKRISKKPISRSSALEKGL